MADITIVQLHLSTFRFPNPNGGRIDRLTGIKRTVGVFPKYVGAGQITKIDTEIISEFLMPSQYGVGTTGVKVKFSFRAQDPIVAGDVIWEAAIEPLTPSVDNSWVESWGTPIVNTAATTPATNGQVLAVSLSMVKANTGNGGTPLAYEACRVRIRRIGTSATDTLVGSVEILGSVVIDDY